MKRSATRPTTLTLLVLLVLPLASAGCANIQAAFNGLTHPVERKTDEDRVSDFEGDYNAAMGVIVYARLQAWLDDEAYEKIEPYRAAANNGIASLKDEVKAGRPIDGSAYLRAVTTGLDQLLVYKTQFEGRVKADQANPKKPTTRPVKVTTPVTPPSPVAPVPAPVGTFPPGPALPSD